MRSINSLFSTLDYFSEDEVYTGSVGDEKVSVKRISIDYPYCNDENYTWQCIVSFESEWMDSVRTQGYSAKEAFKNAFS